jgi:membrane protease YdiL (CAAX protease family)
VLAIGAGVGEELMFRGFLPAVLLTLGYRLRPRS